MPSGAIPYPFGDCRVCGDHATGVHYGVATCEGCKGFYKRSLAKAYKYRCFHGGKCAISPLERNRCKSCRYQRCVMVGMSVDGVKMGRIPKVDKERALEEHYGCGSREILSSGLVIPHTNKRLARDRDSSSNGKGARAACNSTGSNQSLSPGFPEAVTLNNFPGNKHRNGLDMRMPRLKHEDFSESMDASMPYREGKPLMNDNDTGFPSEEIIRGNYEDYRRRTSLLRSSNSRSSSEDTNSDSLVSYCTNSGPPGRPLSLRFEGELHGLRIDEQKLPIGDWLLPYAAQEPIGTAEEFRQRIFEDAYHGLRFEDVRLKQSPEKCRIVRMRMDYNDSLQTLQSSDHVGVDGRYDSEHRWTRHDTWGRPASKENQPYSPGVIREVNNFNVRGSRQSLDKQLLSTTSSCVQRTSSPTPLSSSNIPQNSSCSPESLQSYADNREAIGGYRNENIDSSRRRERYGDLASRDMEPENFEAIPNRLKDKFIWKGVECDSKFLRRCHSVEEIRFNDKLADIKRCGLKRRSLELDDVQVFGRKLFDGDNLRKFGEWKERNWPRDDNLCRRGKKKYELDYMVVDAGQRGKLRDAIDKICEGMAYGDVPILNLDSNAITLNGEPMYDLTSAQFTLAKKGYNGSARIVEVQEEETADLGTDKESHGMKNAQALNTEEAEHELNNEVRYKPFHSDSGCLDSSLKSASTTVLVSDDFYGDAGPRQSVSSCRVEGEPAVKRRLIERQVKQFYADGCKNQTRYFMSQGYLGRFGSDYGKSFQRGGDDKMTMMVRRWSSDDDDLTDGEEAESIRRSRLMNRVLRCIKTFADKLMNLIEIEIGIAVDEATGRRPLHRLNDPDTVIGYEEVCVFWNDFMATLARGNSVIMGLCSNIPGFKQLNVSDQLTLIEQAYYMLWMVLYSRLFWDGECHIRINSEAVYSRGWFCRFFPEPLVERMFYIAEELNKCQLTPNELIVLCALMLTNSECVNLENSARVKRLHEYYLDVLTNEMERNHATNHSQILNKIFELLLLMAPMNQQQLEVVDKFSVDRPPSI